MTNIEESWAWYPKTSSERHRRVDGYAIAYVWAPEICAALAKQDLPVDKKNSARSFEWNRMSGRFASLAGSKATVPLDTLFPGGIRQVTRAMHLHGMYGKRDHETYDLVLTDALGATKMNIVLSFASDIDNASRIVRRVKEAFCSLEETLANEAEEERTAREAEEKRRNEERGYVHPDSFGGSDFS